MEEIRIVKLYSNNSKKSRIKRRKNKFQRIWNSETQKYEKVRKSRFKIKRKSFNKKEENLDLKMKSIKERIVKSNKRKIEKEKQVVQNFKPKAASDIKTHARKNSWVEPKERIYTIHGRNYTFNEETLHYELAA